MPEAQSPAAPTQTPQTQSGPIRIPINVSDASLPITIGIPISEAAGLYDLTRLGVTDANGATVPAQMRALARWRGSANDTTRPVKWLLLDFKPNVKGLHFLTHAVRPGMPRVMIEDAGDAIRVSNSRIEVEFPKSGGGLIKSLKLGVREQLRAPVTARADLPRRALITRLGSAPGAVIVNDTSLLKAGDVARFEHVDTLKWEAPAGSTRLVVNDWSFTAGRSYRIDEGTPRREEVEISSAQPGDLQTTAPLKFNHPAGATIRDLSVEGEIATIKSVSGQTAQFTAPLKSGHLIGEKLIVTDAANQPANAFIV